MKKRWSLFFFVFLIILYILVFYTYNKISINKSKNIKIVESYGQKCINLYKKLRYPNQSLIFRPPVKKPPENMMNDFIMNGKMPISEYSYYNEAYVDSTSENKSAINDIISDQFIDYLEKVRRNESLVYGDKVLNEMMHSYGNFIKDKSVAVIGTQLPWIEAIAFDIGASEITTLDFTRKKYEITNLKWMHVNDYLEEQIKQEKIEHFDVIVSFSSIEHTGLGRYGDPLSPYGDVDAVKQVDCMLKPGGLFFLGIPTTDDGSNKIVFNAHRIYGKERLDLLFKGWNLIDKKKHSTTFHTIFVLKKN